MSQRLSVGQMLFSSAVSEGSRCRRSDRGESVGAAWELLAFCKLVTSMKTAGVNRRSIGKGRNDERGGSYETAESRGARASGCEDARRAYAPAGTLPGRSGQDPA